MAAPEMPLWEWSYYKLFFCTHVPWTGFMYSYEMNKWSNHRKDGQTNERINQQTNNRMNEWSNKQTEQLTRPFEVLVGSDRSPRSLCDIMHQRWPEQIIKPSDGWMNERMNQQTNNRMNEWSNKQTEQLTRPFEVLVGSDRSPRSLCDIMHQRWP